MPGRKTNSAQPAVSTPGSAEQKVALFRRLFRGRDDVYALRWQSRSSGRSGYAPACANEWQPGVCEKPRISCRTAHRWIWCSQANFAMTRRPPWRRCCAMTSACCRRRPPSGKRWWQQRSWRAARSTPWCWCIGPSCCANGRSGSKPSWMSLLRRSAASVVAKPSHRTAGG